MRSTVDGSTNYLTINKLDMLSSLLTPQDAALTPLFAAADPVVWMERITYAGAYLVPFGVVKEPSEAARSEALAAELWTSSEEVVGGVLGRQGVDWV